MATLEQDTVLSDLSPFYSPSVFISLPHNQLTLLSSAFFSFCDFFHSFQSLPPCHFINSYFTISCSYATLSTVSHIYSVIKRTSVDITAFPLPLAEILELLSLRLNIALSVNFSFKNLYTSGKDIHCWKIDPCEDAVNNLFKE